MGRLFGTDGARGVANKELTVSLATAIGKAAAEVLASVDKKPKILIGKYTRISCDMLEAALVAGLCSVGADAVTVGVVPTPCTAFLIKELDCSAGIMISASHNPFEYNGIKWVAEDCGGGVKGYHIDIYYDDHQEALNWGRRTITVKVYY